jgi:hypothetical protein
VCQDHDSFGVAWRAQAGMRPERFAHRLHPIGYGSNHGRNPFTGIVATCSRRFDNRFRPYKAEPVTR